MYKGWIIANKEDAEELRGLGIELGPYNEADYCFESCLVSNEAFQALDPLWYHFYWGLELVKEDCKKQAQQAVSEILNENGYINTLHLGC